MTVVSVVVELGLRLHDFHLDGLDGTNSAAEHAADAPLFLDLVLALLDHEGVTAVVAAGGGAGTAIETDILIYLGLAVPGHHVLHLVAVHELGGDEVAPVQDAGDLGVLLGGELPPLALLDEGHDGLLAVGVQETSQPGSGVAVQKELHAALHLVHDLVAPVHHCRAALDGLAAGMDVLQRGVGALDTAEPEDSELLGFQS